MARYRESDHSNLWVGIAVGGIALGLGAWWLLSKKKSDWKEEIMDVYDGYKDRVVSLANDIGGGVVKDWMKRAKQLFSLFQHYIDLLSSSKGRGLRQGLLIGGAVAGVVVLGAALFSGRSGAHKQGMVDHIVEQANSWRNRISSVVDALEDTRRDVHAHNGAHRPHTGSTVDDVMELVSAGIQLWNKMKS